MKTFRQLLSSSNRESIFNYLVEKDSTYACEADRPTHEVVSRNYTHVIEELLDIENSESIDTPLYVDKKTDCFDPKIVYVDVTLKNLNYVAPSEGLKAWGCENGGDPPEGYYDCNADKHQEFFAISFVEWNKLIDTEVILGDNVKDMPIDSIVAEILWELTFYGWTQKQQKEEDARLKEILDERVKNISDDDFITSEDLMNILKNEEK
jgi:hypothetical protein